MKKTACLFLALLLLLCASTGALCESVFQEPFSIRSGIRFGMTYDEVRAAETATVSSDTQLLTYAHSPTRYAAYLYYSGLTLAGYADTDLQYGFDEYGELKDITYLLGKLGDKAYDDLLSKLSGKYGEPQFTAPSVLETEALRMYTANDSISNNSLHRYNGWLLSYTDCYVKMELVSAKSVISGKSFYWNVIGYRLISFEEFQSVADQIVRFEESVSQSVDSDL